MQEVYQKSNNILSDNIKWLLYSDIRIKNGPDKGALFGWKNLNPVSFPFIYSEITGYAITYFLWIYTVLNNIDALQAAKDSSTWIIKNMKNNILDARPSISNNSDESNHQYYAFDNGMIMIGLLNLHKMTKDVELLTYAESIARTLIDRFFDGSKLIARLDESFNPISSSQENGIIKWSTVSGSYHAKISIGLLELSRLTNNVSYKEVSNAICNYAISQQKPNGQFITNPDSNLTYLHPHLYSCEGLIYSGLTQSNSKHHSAGLKGLLWAIKQLDDKPSGGLRASTKNESIEQSDCTAQLLRLLILCRSALEEHMEKYKIDNIIKKVHSRLLDFYTPTGDGQGGMKYHLELGSVCSWCTMFSAQALHLWQLQNSWNNKWLEFFV